MSDELPTQMPPRPPPHPVTRVPRVFNIWGTLVYAGCSFTAFASMIAYGFGWNPPWPIMLSALFYVGVSAGIIAFGRMEANKDARFFVQALRKRSDENGKRAMRKMN
jgi:hypothetical protein